MVYIQYSDQFCLLVDEVWFIYQDVYGVVLWRVICVYSGVCCVTCILLHVVPAWHSESILVGMSPDIKGEGGLGCGAQPEKWVLRCGHNPERGGVLVTGTTRTGGS